MIDKCREGGTWSYSTALIPAVFYHPVMMMMRMMMVMMMMEVEVVDAGAGHS